MNTGGAFAAAKRAEKRALVGLKSLETSEKADRIVKPAKPSILVVRKD